VRPQDAADVLRVVEQIVVVGGSFGVKRVFI
jgi:hypothetical protein